VPNTGIITGGITSTGISAQVIQSSQLIRSNYIVSTGLTSTGVSTTTLSSTTLTASGNISTQTILAPVTSNPVSLFSDTSQFTVGTAIGKVQLSTLTMTADAIEPAVPTTGTIKIGALQIDGTLNIGTSTTRASNITVGNAENVINVYGTPTINSFVNAVAGVTTINSVNTGILGVTSNAISDSWNADDITCKELTITDIPSNSLIHGYRIAPSTGLGALSFDANPIANQISVACTILYGNRGARPGVWIYDFIMQLDGTTTAYNITCSFSTSSTVMGNNRFPMRGKGITANPENLITTRFTMTINTFDNVYLLYTTPSTTGKLTSLSTTVYTTKIG
jgi:hypothetical protein